MLYLLAMNQCELHERLFHLKEMSFVERIFWELYTYLPSLFEKSPPNCCGLALILLKVAIVLLGVAKKDIKRKKHLRKKLMNLVVIRIDTGYYMMLK